MGFHVTFLGKKLSPVPSARDLGVQMDATLSRYAFNIPAFKSAAGQSTFLYRSVSWNSLPSNLKDSISIDHFKRDYKMYLLEQF